LDFLQSKMEKILAENDMQTDIIFTHENFVDFSIMMGSDYTERIKDITHDQLFETFVLNNMNVPETVTFLRPLADIPDTFLTEWRQAKTYYMEEMVINPEKINKTLSKPNRDEIINIMCVENNFDLDCVNGMIDELETMYVAFNGMQNNALFKSFKSYQLKYQYQQQDKPQPSNHARLTVGRKDILAVESVD
jgi:hypothetical protein